MSKTFSVDIGDMSPEKAEALIKEIAQKAYDDYLKNAGNPIETGETVDYTIYKDGGKLLGMLGDSGHNWAVAFSQYYFKQHGVKLDVDFLTVWFANAIEHSTQIRLFEMREENRRLEEYRMSQM
jgi:hypothetical protein